MNRERIEEALIEAADEILGLPADEMKENMELDMIENGLIDSLGIVALLQDVEERIGKHIDLSKMTPDDFTSLATMTTAIEKII